MDSALEVTVTANFVNAWFLLVATTPAVVVDEAVHRLAWSQPTRVAVEPGSHEVAVGIRYRGFSAVLGKAPETVPYSRAKRCGSAPVTVRSTVIRS